MKRQRRRRSEEEDEQEDEEEEEVDEDAPHVRLSTTTFTPHNDNRNDNHNDNDNNQDDTTSGDKTRFLALHVTPDAKGNVQVGAAVLDCGAGHLSTLGRTVAWEGELAFVLEQVMDHCQAAAGGGVDAVLVSSKLSEPFQDALAEVLSGLTQIVLPSSFFDFSLACRLMGSRFDIAHALGAVMDLTNRASVSCAGAAFSHAQRVFPELPLSMCFSQFALDKFLVIDGASLKALDVVKAEEHPSVIRGRGRAKEGFTLLSLLDRTKTPLGGKTLRRWVVRPLTQLAAIEERQQAVDFLLQRVGQESAAKTAKLLAQVGDLPRSLLRLKTCAAKARDWLVLGESLTSMSLCFQLLRQVKEQHQQHDGASLPVLLDAALAAGDAAGLVEVGKALDCVDWELLRGGGGGGGGGEIRVVPIAGASAAVDEARQRLLALPDFLTAETASANTPGLTIRCIPVIGFVAAVEYECALFHAVGNRPGGGGGATGGGPEEPPPYEFLFEARRQAPPEDAPLADDDSRILVRYYKTERARYLDEQLGDVIGICRDTEDGFMRQVEEIVLAHEADLLLVAHRCAEVDVLLSLAEVAHDFGYVRPELFSLAEGTGGCVTELRGARHPLLERVLDDKFVPSDVVLGQQILVITGPNFSGKSVVLKTVALLTIMAQIGSFVPATLARMSLVDRIFTRMSGLESVASAPFQRESSFSIDVQQVVSMLRSCTRRSLLCIDEFGKGTNTVDGAALLAAVVHQLSQAEDRAPPRTLVATHLVEMFDAQLLEAEGEGEEAVSVVVLGEMRVEFQSDGEPVPLFRLVCGIRQDAARDSYGIACAKRVGMHPAVVERALELCDRLRHNQPLLAGSSSSSDKGGDGEDDTMMRHQERAVKELLVSPTLPPEWTDEAIETFFGLLAM